ncbi:MAG: hypothetical protein A2958_00570 [Candidatus Levybacteria bacterium RIFCSPLOWO2_01_FULL_38_13]|nr:MAG: hypothetical protein A2629_00465 [Candidatus Levybacteria bacterium RIFCSPHIGHO2_01_FULL_41_15]OGH34783.1 MAG: hypothetical protein A2958_00570 [Candidatus Levybacteria bacterium RIFCSPLOWO2_01_FULL_38_13]
MPEAYLSKERTQAFHALVRKNKDSIIRVALDTNTNGYTVGVTKAPMLIVFETHIDRLGEAKLYYPTELEGKLAEAGVIFEQGVQTPEATSAMPIGELVTDPGDQV